MIEVAQPNLEISCFWTLFWLFSWYLMIVCTQWRSRLCQTTFQGTYATCSNRFFPSTPAVEDSIKQTVTIESKEQFWNNIDMDDIWIYLTYILLSWFSFCQSWFISTSFPPSWLLLVTLKYPSHSFLHPDANHFDGCLWWSQLLSTVHLVMSSLRASVVISKAGGPSCPTCKGSTVLGNDWNTSDLSYLIIFRIIQRWPQLAGHEIYSYILSSFNHFNHWSRDVTSPCLKIIQNLMAQYPPITADRHLRHWLRVRLRRGRLSRRSGGGSLQVLLQAVDASVEMLWGAKLFMFWDTKKKQQPTLYKYDCQVVINIQFGMIVGSPRVDLQS